MPRLNFLSPHESAIAPHFLALPDYESDRTSYELTVRASDGGLHADVTVTVNVTDVEEQSVVEDTVPEPLPSVSEPYYTGGDFSEDVSTTGRVAVGDTATGEIGISGDRDWFAVELVAGRTYIIDLRGRPTEDGTLRDPYLHGIHDAEGNLISGTTNDNGGEDSNSRLVLTARDRHSLHRGRRQLRPRDLRVGGDSGRFFGVSRDAGHGRGRRYRHRRNRV